MSCERHPVVMSAVWESLDVLGFTGDRSGYQQQNYQPMFCEPASVLMRMMPPRRN